ncbi:uncharacterized protein LOC107274683 [Cephus cinctus]|uniref:Uncharacterized protein LOC107274683 n=1 Tax=Cephus cinctus TaxID=211228 RepID=A0AAJ7FUX7_CEPCN|nr:uncharacterized protein LOC107274683 [Cephus cinctus]
MADKKKEAKASDKKSEKGGKTGKGKSDKNKKKGKIIMGGTIGLQMKPIRGQYYNVVTSIDAPMTSQPPTCTSYNKPPICCPPTCYYPPICCPRQPRRRCC